MWATRKYMQTLLTSIKALTTGIWPSRAKSGTVKAIGSRSVGNFFKWLFSNERAKSKSFRTNATWANIRLACGSSALTFCISLARRNASPLSPVINSNRESTVVTRMPSSPRRNGRDCWMRSIAGEISCRMSARSSTWCTTLKQRNYRSIKKLVGAATPFLRCWRFKTPKENFQMAVIRRARTQTPKQVKSAQRDAARLVRFNVRLY